MPKSTQYPGQYKFRVNINKRMQSISQQNKRPTIDAMSIIKHGKQQFHTRQRIVKLRDNKRQQEAARGLLVERLLSEQAMKKCDL